MNRKLQVFISATYKDLEVERRAAVDAILDAKHIPEGMEFFAAESREQMDVIKQKIRESDVLLILLGARYGSVEPESGKSYTHLEFQYALEIKKPVIAMVMKPEAVQAWEKENFRDIERNTGDKLEAFKKDVTTKRLASFFGSVDELKFAILKALVKANDNADLMGWIRRDEAVNAPAILTQMAELSRENSTLRAEVTLLKEQAQAMGTLVLPSEATESVEFEFVQPESGQVLKGKTTHFAWFLDVGWSMGPGIIGWTFDNLSIGHFAKLTGKDLKDWSSSDYATICRKAVEVFSVYGWIEVKSTSTSNKIVDIYRLTELGRRLLRKPPQGPETTPVNT